MSFSLRYFAVAKSKGEGLISDVDGESSAVHHGFLSQMLVKTAVI